MRPGKLEIQFASLMPFGPPGRYYLRRGPFVERRSSEISQLSFAIGTSLRTPALSWASTSASIPSPRCTRTNCAPPLTGSGCAEARLRGENRAIQMASAQGAHWPRWWDALMGAQANGAPGMGRHAFAVRVLASGRLAGTLGFPFIDPRHATCEIGGEVGSAGVSRGRGERGGEGADVGEVSGGFDVWLRWGRYPSTIPCRDGPPPPQKRGRT